jgi:ribosomal protein L29
MKFKELKAMTNEEMEGKLKELRMELIKANAQIATGTVPKNPGQVKQTKKTIAKIKQILGTPAEKKAAPKKEEKAEDKKEPKPEPKSQSDKSNKNKTEEKQE